LQESLVALDTIASKSSRSRSKQVLVTFLIVLPIRRNRTQGSSGFTGSMLNSSQATDASNHDLPCHVQVNIREQAQNKLVATEHYAHPFVVHFPKSVYTVVDNLHAKGDHLQTSRTQRHITAGRKTGGNQLPNSVSEL
jgi:hypothetical protein